MAGSPTTSSLLKHSISVLAAGLGPFISLALIVHIPTLIWGLAEVLWVDLTDLLEERNTAVVAAVVFAVFLILLLEALATAIMVSGVFQLLRGAPLQIGECLRLAAARWPEVMGLAILTILAVVGGLLLCLLPGIVVICGLFVAMPALLVERLRIIEAMKRSWSLTEGYKTVIFFFLVVIEIFRQVPAAIARVLSWSSLGDTLAGDLTFTFLNYGFYVFATAISAVAAAVAYNHLRVFREGLATQKMVPR